MCTASEYLELYVKAQGKARGITVGDADLYWFGQEPAEGKLDRPHEGGLGMRISQADFSRADLSQCLEFAELVAEMQDRYRLQRIYICSAMLPCGDGIQGTINWDIDHIVRYLKTQ